MKLILFAILLSMSLPALSADMVMPIRRVIDGDTISTTLDIPCPLCLVSIRILGIDTPESNYQAKCAKEKTLGLAAKAHTQALAAGSKTMLVRNIKWDKYGGRINGYVEINGVDVGTSLIEKGLARPYPGQGPKSDWCN